MAKDLENVLWASANKLRGGLHSSEYMHVTLGLIFLKYLSDRFEIKYANLVEEGKGFENDKDEYLSDGVFWLPKKARWIYIQAFSKQPEIGQKLDEAFIEIEKENPELKGVLPKTYSKQEVDKRRLGELIDLFTNELDTTDEKQRGDYIGKVYEYFLGTFARNLGQKGGEFYTPRSIVELLVEMIEPYNGRVYDPCCGSGGMFVHSANFVKEHQGVINDIAVYGQELNATTWKLCKMNLAIRGIECNLGDSNADTFHDDKHKSLRADYILANPPFNIKDYGQTSLKEDPRWSYGIPPEGNANYAWIQHIVSKLAPNGVAGFVLANGSLSTSNKSEYEIRGKMLEEGIIDCIITLPDKLFLTTGIPVSLWFLRKTKTNKEVLFIDCREMGTMIDRKTRELTAEDIKKITSTYHNYLKDENYVDEIGFCKVANLDEIKQNDYSLVCGRYVGIKQENKLSDEELQAEIEKTKAELFSMFEENAKLENKIKDVLKNDNIELV